MPPPPLLLILCLIKRREPAVSVMPCLPHTLLMVLLLLLLRMLPSGKCNSQSMRAALNLRGMKEALAGSRKLLSKKYDNCAVVGNSGGDALAP